MGIKKQLKHKICLLMALLLLLPCFILSGCGGKTVSLNEVELLTAKETVSLLNQHGLALEENTDFLSDPEDGAAAQFSGVSPTVYFSPATGSYYLFYVLDSYIKSSDSPRWRDDFQSSNILKESMLYGFSGKNLILQTAYPGAMELYQGDNQEGRDKIAELEEEFQQTQDILFEYAFNGKNAVYKATSESWEVQIPVKYFSNVLENEDGEIGLKLQYDDYSRGTLKLKYLSTEEPLNSVSYVGYDAGNTSGYTQTDTEDSLFTETDENGYFTPYFSISIDSPGEKTNVTITVKWNGDREEELVCIWAGEE